MFSPQKPLELVLLLTLLRKKNFFKGGLQYFNEGLHALLLTSSQILTLSDEKMFNFFINKVNTSSNFEKKWENEHLSHCILFHISMYFEIHPHEMMLVYLTSFTSLCVSWTIIFSCFKQMNKSLMIFTCSESSIRLKLTWLQILIR